MVQFDQVYLGLHSDWMLTWYEGDRPLFVPAPAMILGSPNSARGQFSLQQCVLVCFLTLLNFTGMCTGQKTTEVKLETAYTTVYLCVEVFLGRRQPLSGDL